MSDWRETLTRALLDYWVRHQSTTPGEVGTPENVFYSVKAAVDVLAPVFDRLDATAGVRGNMLRYIAFVTTGDEAGDAQLGVDRMKAEVERLTAAIAEKDPWTGLDVDDRNCHCYFCRGEYEHAPGCVWVSARVATDGKIVDA